MFFRLRKRTRRLPQLPIANLPSVKFFEHHLPRLTRQREYRGLDGQLLLTPGNIPQRLVTAAIGQCQRSLRCDWWPNTLMSLVSGKVCLQCDWSLTSLTHCDWSLTSFNASRLVADKFNAMRLVAEKFNAFRLVNW